MNLSVKRKQLLDKTSSHVESCSIGVSAQTGCGPTQFQCNDGSCIEQTQRCDGRTDCADFSDEQQCRKFQPPTTLSLRLFPNRMRTHVFPNKRWMRRASQS